MKKALALLLALSMLCSLAACSGSKAEAEAATPTPVATPVPSPETEEEAEEVGMANPMEDVADLAALLKDQPTIQMNDAPVGAGNVVYSIIHNIPVITQICFDYKGASYTYRAAFGKEVVDISGVYTPLSTVVSGTMAKENMAGGAYTLRYDSASGEAVANWGSELSGCHYSLFSDCACKGSTEDFLTILKSLYTCAPNTRNARGTVNAVMGSSLVVALEDGTTAVLDTSYIEKLSIMARDIVSFSYMGDLAGTAYLIAVAKTGEALETATFSGTVIRFNDDSLFVSTSDNNVFLFNRKGATISGKSNSLAQYYSVVVTYTGDLYSNPTAVNIEITNTNPVAPTPTPTATPAPVNRQTSGVVTSVAGSYVTVNSLCFDVSGKIVSGTPVVGYNANIYFTDYGNTKYLVTAAYFEAPKPVSYTVSGTVSSVNQVDANNYFFTINGYYIHLNTRGCGGSGTLQNNATGYVEYVIENGVNEATYASFTAPAPTPTPGPQYHYLYGIVESSGSVNESTRYFILSDGTQFIVAENAMTGTPVAGASVEGNYYYDQASGQYVAVYAFFTAPTPDPDPATEYFNGVVESVSAGASILFFTLDNGLKLQVDYDKCSGDAHEGCGVWGYYLDVNDVNDCASATFYELLDQ